MWQPLFQHFSAIAVLVVCLQLLADRIGDIRSRIGRMALGWVCGLAACLSIAFATPMMSGFYFDLRGPLVACAAFFGGWIAVGPTVALTVIMRIYMGGAGVEAGILGVVAITAAGLGLRARTGDRKLTPLVLVGITAGTTASSFLGYLLVPWNQLPAVLERSFLPVTVFNFSTTMVLLALVTREHQRSDLVSENGIYRQMVDALPDSMSAKDKDGRFIAANPATAELMGAASSQELIGRTDADYYPPDESAEFLAFEREVMANAQPQVTDQKVVVEGKDALWVSTQKIPLISEGGNVEGVITHQRDVTADRALTKVKAEFVATVSHELRTPLTSVRGSLAILKSVCTDALPPSVGKLHDIAHRNSERLSHMIDDLLDVEKIESGGLEFELDDHRLADIIAAALPGLSNYMPTQDITIKFANHASDAVARVEPGRFEQVLANLVSNAIKFSAPGGVVTIGISRGEGKVVISVSDRGQGIPDAFKHRVFSAFDQADGSTTKAKGGTGLGLHIAKVMVEKMSGTVRFASEEGAGTTFYVELPDRTRADFADERPDLLGIPPQAQPRRTRPPESQSCPSS